MGLIKCAVIKLHIYLDLQIGAEIQHFQDKRLQTERDHGSLLAAVEEKRAKLQRQAEIYEKEAGVTDNLLESVKAGEGTLF